MIKKRAVKRQDSIGKKGLAIRSSAANWQRDLSLKQVQDVDVLEHSIEAIDEDEFDRIIEKERSKGRSGRPSLTKDVIG